MNLSPWITLMCALCSKAFVSHGTRPSFVALQQSFNIAAASEPLFWERLEDRSSQPVLDLSRRDDGTESDTNDDGDDASSEEWGSGQLWEVTSKGLSDRNIEDTGDFLSQCPQLLRLEPTAVLETADWLLDEFDASYITTEPRLLSYKLADVQYGLEFLSIMMATPNPKILCTPALFVSLGVDGGLQERAAQAALGAASHATYSTNKQVAAESMTAYKAIRRKRGLE